LIESLYLNQRAVISINGKISEKVQIIKGVRQGCVLSPSLFNAYSENMMIEAIGGDRNGVSIGGSKIQAIKFADDQAIVSGSAKELQKMVNKINCTAKKCNMKINASKTKIMVIAKT